MSEPALERAATPLALGVVGVAAVLLAAVAAAWWPDLGLGLAAETAPLAWLQANALVACATASLVCATRACEPAVMRGWGLVALGILAASLDERFMWHEAAQALIADALVAIGHWEPDRAERGAQSLTALYALGGVGLALWWRRRVGAAAWVWMRAALAVGGLAIGMDLASDRLDAQVIEECLEFAAESLLLAGLITEAGRPASRSR